MWLVIFFFVALFVASTAMRPSVFMSLLQASFHMVFGRHFSLLLAMSVITTLRCVLFVHTHHMPRPFQSFLGYLLDAVRGYR